MAHRPEDLRSSVLQTLSFGAILRNRTQEGSDKDRISPRRIEYERQRRLLIQLT